MCEDEAADGLLVSPPHSGHGALAASDRMSYPQRQHLPVRQWRARWADHNKPPPATIAAAAGAHRHTSHARATLVPYDTVLKPTIEAYMLE